MPRQGQEFTIRYLLAMIAFLVAFRATAEPAFERYTGVLHHQHLQQDQLARLDFLSEESVSGDLVRLRATLVLYFGDFESDEYASYYYDNVTYNRDSKTLIFDSSEREVHFVVHNFSDGIISAELKSGLGVVGQLTLKKGQEAHPKRPLVQKIWGEYRGICDGTGRRIQIQSTPNHPIATNRSDPFAPFIIMAQVGINGGHGCTLGAGTCVTETYHDADYDFFTGHIDFHGYRGSLACDIDATGMICGGCRYERSSNEAVRPGNKKVPVHAPEWTLMEKSALPSAVVPRMNQPPEPANDLQGVYKGFVHIAQRDIYQPMSIAVTTYPDLPQGENQQANKTVTMISSIRYGGHTDMDEAINTKFDARPVDQLLSGESQVFDRADNSSDTLLHIDRIHDGKITGAWYSRRFGFVGKFLLTKSGQVVLQQPRKQDSRLTGTFSNGKLTIQMMVAMSDRAISSKDPFSPLTLQGQLWYPNLTTRKPFTDTAFDPFTGKFSLDTDGPGGAFIGKRNKEGIRIKIPNQGIMRPMQSHSFVELVETDDEI